VRMERPSTAAIVVKMRRRKRTLKAGAKLRSTLASSACEGMGRRSEGKECSVKGAMGDIGGGNYERGEQCEKCHSARQEMSRGKGAGRGHHVQECRKSRDLGAKEEEGGGAGACLYDWILAEQLAEAQHAEHAEHGCANAAAGAGGHVGGG
jgi:hypothetical protein